MMVSFQGWLGLSPERIVEVKTTVAALAQRCRRVPRERPIQGEQRSRVWSTGSDATGVASEIMQR